LDPVADKLMVGTALVAVAAAHPSAVLVTVACMHINREIWVSALREWAATQKSAEATASAAEGERDAQATEPRLVVGDLGKLKAATQFVALQLILTAYVIDDPEQAAMVYYLGVGLLVVSAGFGVASAWQYTKSI